MSNLHIAENSRPRRQYKEDTRRKKPSGRKREHGPKDAERTNWQSPFLWAPIEAAARKAAPTYSPTEIVQTLQRGNPILYAKLHVRTLQRWLQDSKLRF